jgi:hypothetical protein
LVREPGNAALQIIKFVFGVFWFFPSAGNRLAARKQKGPGSLPALPVLFVLEAYAAEISAVSTLIPRPIGELTASFLRYLP